MSVSWAWPFGNESAAVLQSLGWIPSTISATYFAPKNGAAEVFSYTGSPARWSLGIAPGQYIYTPSDSYVNKGWVTMAHRATTVSAQNGGFLSLLNAYSSNNLKGVYAYRTYVSVGSFVLDLYVDNVFKERTTLIDARQWHYYALKYDQSGATWSGQLYIDGVAVTASYTDASAASTAGFYFTYGFSSGTRETSLAQFIVYDDLADAGEKVRWVTRGNPTSDVSEVGVWTPSTGVDNYAVVDDPLVLTDYTDEPTPNIADNQVLDCPDIATICGITPANIDGVVALVFAAGAGHTAHAAIGDGTSFVNGAVKTVPAAGSAGALHASSALKPSGGAWAGTTVPRLKYELDTV